MFCREAILAAISACILFLTPPLVSAQVDPETGLPEDVPSAARASDPPWHKPHVTASDSREAEAPELDPQALIAGSGDNSFDASGDRTGDGASDKQKSFARSASSGPENGPSEKEGLSQAMDQRRPVERFPSSSSERTARRGYPGGRDEQDLKPQLSLPQPARSLDSGGAAPLVAPARNEPAPD